MRRAERRAAGMLTMPRPGQPPRPRVPTPLRWEMANGLRVVAVPHRALPQAVIRIVLPAGSAEDPAGFPGTAAMVAALLTEGTETLDATTLNARLDLLGAAIHTQAGHDFAEVELSTLSETLPEALAIFAEVVMRPTFPVAETERIRAETLDSLEARLDEPANVADDAAADALYGPDHPYGRLTSGTVDGVSSVPREQLQAFHARRFIAEGSVLIAAGDFDPTDLRIQLERLLGDWSGSATVRAPVPDIEAPLLAGERLMLPWESAAQGEIRVVGAGLHRAHHDWVPAAVANYILGGSTITSRLGMNLREDKGWTYGVRSGFAAARHTGGWMVDTAVDVEVVEQALDEIIGEIDRFRSSPVPGEELERAQNAIALSLPRAFETPGRIVGRFATLEAYELPADYWDSFVDRVGAVTIHDIRRIAEENFDTSRLASVTVGVPAGAETGAVEE